MGDGIPAMAILLVDDEARLRRTVARSLAARGHRVVEAASTREAVAAATAPEADLDLLVLDVNLPDGTCWDVLRELDTAGRNLPTVIVSAVPPSAARVREFRPLGVLHKPFPMEALLRLVRLAADPPTGGRDGARRVG